MEKEGIKIVVTNKKASFNYFLSDYIEAGLVLTGTEIKSIRAHKCSISDSYVVFKGNEAFLLNMNISVYDLGNIFNHDPLRSRKLLLNKREILKYQQKVVKEGYTIVPTKVYLRKGMAKVEIALAKGKKLYDKRETIKERDDKRSMEKAVKRG
ncbi:MAG: SsrA-binding protein SmpB [Bacilli bacterium]|jgi:SsrA-binding protein|nr:SsrA-binding protein SmpB [Bacilli bacterium]